MAASQSRSRCVLAPIALPFSTASRPRLSVAASNGPTSGFGRWLTAMPQYAIAQLGSVSGIAVNALIVSGKKKEWSIARARSNCCCASGEQVVLKRTRPSFSPRVFAESSCAAAVVAKTKAVRTTTREVLLRLISRLQGWRVGRPSLPHRRGGGLPLAFVVCPGAIRTRAHDRSSKDVIDKVRSSVPMGYVAEPDDVAGVV